MTRRPLKRVSESQNRKISELADKAIEQGSYFDISEVFPSAALDRQADDTLSLPKQVNERARRVRILGVDYQKEYVLYVLNELKLKGITNDQVAHIFKVHPRTVSNWIKDLNTEYTKAAKEIDPYIYVGTELRRYEKLVEESFKLLTNDDIEPKERILAIAAVAKVLDGKTRFMEKVGFMGHIDIRPLYEPKPEEVTLVGKITKLREITKLGAGEHDEVEVEIPMGEDGKTE